MYEATGKIKVINDTQTFGSGFTKREFVVTTQRDENDKYPQDVKFEIVKDKCSLLDSYSLGQEVVVSFDIRGNEYNGKYYVNLNCWKIQASGAATPNPSATPFDDGPSNFEPSADDLSNDDIPF